MREREECKTVVEPNDLELYGEILNFSQRQAVYVREHVWLNKYENEN